MIKLHYRALYSLIAPRLLIPSYPPITPRAFPTPFHIPSCPSRPTRTSNTAQMTRTPRPPKSLAASLLHQSPPVKERHKTEPLSVHSANVKKSTSRTLNKKLPTSRRHPSQQTTRTACYELRSIGYRRN
jgi:hypothetical protein